MTASRDRDRDATTNLPCSTQLTFADVDDRTGVHRVSRLGIGLPFDVLEVGAMVRLPTPPTLSRRA